MSARSPATTRHLACALALLSALVAGIDAQERPLPDAATFLAESRKHLARDSSRQSSYSYVETRRDQKLDARGRVTEEEVKVLESYPGLPGEERWERVISVNGVAVPARKLEEQDAERRRKAEAYAKRVAQSPEQVNAAQRKKFEESAHETDQVLDDIFRVYDISMLRREAIEGHDTIAFALRPKPKPQPRTREGSIMRHFVARAWISESDHELVRIEADAIENVPFGLGIVARIHKGSTVRFERRKVNGEAWLPAVSSYRGSARVGLVAVVRRGSVSEYSGYRKFGVGTSETFSPPSNP
jgi:hypothetical protein